jgi:hypothetical protein
MQYSERQTELLYLTKISKRKFKIDLEDIWFVKNVLRNL